MDVRFGSRGYNFVEFCGRTGIGDVLRHGTVEQERVLQNGSDIPAQALKRYLFDVDAVELHRPRGRLVETRYKFRYRRLARSGCAYECYHFARFACEAYVVQYVLTVAVVETHVVESYLAARFADIHGVGRVVYLYRRIEYLYRAFARSVRGLHVLDEPREVLHRRKEQR